MHPDPFTLETTLDDHSLARLAAGLAAQRFPGRVEGRSVVFHKPETGAEASKWIERLIDYNRRIHRAEKRAGRPLRRYKPRDEADLILAVCLGVMAGDLPSLLHEVVWRQPFPNANHRTAVAVVLEELGSTSGLAALRAMTGPFFEESKKLMDGSDEALSDEQAKAAHRDVMVRLVDALQSMS